MAKLKEKFLLVVSFLEGRQFPRQPKTKFLIEAKFDGEQLATDPVDHVETLEVNQELAWELDKKALHMHKLQRSCIKAMCYALKSGGDDGVVSKELVGYIVLDVKSAPDGMGKPKWYPLLQPKYQKSKPNLHINVYIESDEQSNNLVDIKQQHPSTNPLVSQSTSHMSLRPPLNSILTKNAGGGSLNSLNNSLNDLNLNQVLSATSINNKQLKVTLIESEGFYLIGNANTTIPTQTYSLTITIAFARNLIRLFTDDASIATTGRNFYFVYTLLNNQVTTKPFSDIIACQINGERSTIRLHASFNNLKSFFQQQNSLDISFCSEERVLGKCYLKWKSLLDEIEKESLDEMIVLDELLKFEATLQAASSTISGRRSPSPIIDMSPVIGVQITLSKENASELNNLNVLSTIVANQNSIVSHPPKPILTSTTHIVTSNDPIKPNLINTHQNHNHYKNNQQYEGDKQNEPKIKTSSETGLIGHNENATVSFDDRSQKNKEFSLNLKSNSSHSIGFNQHQHQPEITEMYLKAAYELQLWKEAREQEFEQELKKREAKKFQALAEAFKQHEIEREMIMQKKIKEYTELETVLKNSLNEGEKREKKLAQDEIRLARIKADLNHEYEQKLTEMRDASKRVQEKADHQVSMQNSKCDMLEQDLAKAKKIINELEKKMADKDADFLRYKEKENMRPEVRLQSELNVLHLEKVELERKLEAMIKAKNHYKEQWTRALQEIALIKKKEEENAKAQLKKQQQELEHLRLRYLAAEENELVMKASSSREDNIDKVRRQRSGSLSGGDNSTESSSSISYHNQNHQEQFHLDKYKIEDADLQEHISRLVDERDTLLRTGVYSNTDAIIIELDKRIRDCLKEAKLIENNNVNNKQLKRNL